MGLSVYQLAALLLAPHLDRLIATPTDQRLPVGADGYTVNRA